MMFDQKVNNIIMQIIVAFVILIAVGVWVLARKLPKKRRETMMAVLGSGGHTTQMLYTIQHFDFNRLKRVIFAVADTDKTSFGKCQNFFEEHKIKTKDTTWFNLPRSRQVKQSYITSVFTTLKSLAACFYEIYFKFRDVDLLVMNGPGTCVPIAYVYFILNKLRLTNTKMVFIESWCRVDRLSLTGKLLKPIVHEFIVHWEELKSIKGCKYYGSII